jgi:hypothetical protein
LTKAAPSWVERLAEKALAARGLAHQRAELHRTGADGAAVDVKDEGQAR